MGRRFESYLGYACSLMHLMVKVLRQGLKLYEQEYSRNRSRMEREDGSSCKHLVKKKTLCFKFAFLAQLVERLPCKKRVVGSSPTVGSNLPLWWNGRHFRFRI